MSGTLPSPRPDDFATKLETATKTAVLFAVLAYVAGLLIVNIYLVGLGLPNAELTQTRYVLVGSLWIVLVATMFFAVRAATGLFVRRNGHRWSTVALRAAGGLLPIFVGAMIISSLMFEQTAAPVSSRGVATTLIVGCTAIVIVSALGIFRALTSVDDSSDANTASFMGALVVVMQIAATCLLLGLYSTYSYPAFSSAIGGGASYGILLAPAAEKDEALRRLHLNRRADGLIGPCELLFEDSNSYFLRIQHNGRSTFVRASKSLFDGAISTR